MERDAAVRGRATTLELTDDFWSSPMIECPATTSPTAIPSGAVTPLRTELSS